MIWVCEGGIPLRETLKSVNKICRNGIPPWEWDRTRARCFLLREGTGRIGSMHFKCNLQYKLHESDVYFVDVFFVMFWLRLEMRQKPTLDKMCTCCFLAKLYTMNNAWLFFGLVLLVKSTHSSSFFCYSTEGRSLSGQRVSILRKGSKDYLLVGRFLWVCIWLEYIFVCLFQS